jgi:hypothetical protein
VLVRLNPAVVSCVVVEVLDSAAFVGGTTTAVAAGELAHPVRMTMMKMRESNFLGISFILSPQR